MSCFYYRHSKEIFDMEFKLNLDYQESALQYIQNQKLAEEIQNNIQFVDKYYGDVDSRYKEVEDQQIVYKQLGIIAFSCVEALWKGIVMTVNENCAKRKCSCKQCKYKKFETREKINRASVDKVLDHLVNMRLLYVHPFEREEIEELQQLRNHIHLTRTVTDEVDRKIFDKDFVENMLRLYYVTLNQLDLCNWYFSETAPCLKEMDEDGYKATVQQREKDRKEYFTQKLLGVCYTIFYHKPLNIKDKKRLTRLKTMKDIDQKNFADSLGRFLYYEWIHYRTDDAYAAAIETFLGNLKNFLSPESKLIEEIKERMKYYQNQNRGSEG